MAMDIYVARTKEYLNSINEIKSIQKPLDIFMDKTGLSIDEYRRTRLSLGHIKLLYSLIEDENKWKEIFRLAIENEYELIIEGD